MSVTVKFTNSVPQQSQIIPNATLFNDGVMTKEQVAQLAAGGDCCPVVTSVKTPADSPYNAVVRDVVRCATSEDDDLNVQLPAISEENSGQIITIKKVNTDLTSVHVLPTGADTIDGALSNQVNGLKATRTFMSDGDGTWMIVYF